MSGINERIIALRKGGTETHLAGYLDSRKVISQALNETSKLTVVSANFTLLSSAYFASLTSITVLPNPLQTEGDALVVSVLAGAIGAGNVKTDIDLNGRILNEVEVVAADTHDPITTTDGFEVFGLMQVPSTANDGDAIGAGGSENVQVSFVYRATDGTITLYALNQEIQFTRSICRALRYRPSIEREGGASGADVIKDPTAKWIWRRFKVTTAFAIGEILTLSTGAGSISGACSIESGSSAITIPASAALWYQSENFEAYDDGVLANREDEIMWSSTDAITVWRALDVDDEILVREFYADVP